MTACERQASKVQSQWPRDSTRYVSAVLQLRSGFAPPSGKLLWLRFGSASTTGVVWPRSFCDNYIIAHNHSHICQICVIKTINIKCSWLKEWRKSLYLSLFWDSCGGNNTECFILKSNWMLYCCFVAWLPVCSVQLNCCVMLRHPPEIEVLFICSTGLPELGRGRYTAQQTWWLTECRGAPANLKRNLSSSHSHSHNVQSTYINISL